MQEIINKLWNEGFTIVISLFSFGLVYVTIWAIAHKLSEHANKKFDRLVKLFKFRKEKETLNQETIKLIETTSRALIELRVKMSADRAYIFEFHNGEYFLSNQPRWKMSQTHEICSDSIAPSELRNLDVSLFWEFMRIFFLRDDYTLPDGITRIQKNPFCNLEHCNVPRGSYLIDIKKLNPNIGHSKMFFVKRNVLYSFVSPIIDSNNNVIGFVGVDYNDEDNFHNTFEEELFTSCHVCKIASEFACTWEINPNSKHKMIDDFKEKFHIEKK